ncbi:unnamed protein product, partial [marine sediment metagenome]
LQSRGQKVEFIIAKDSWNSGWINLSYSGGNEYRLYNSQFFDFLSNLENGIYSVWLKGTDNNGYTTLERFEFEIESEQPQIEQNDRDSTIGGPLVTIIIATTSSVGLSVIIQLRRRRRARRIFGEK